MLWHPTHQLAPHFCWPAMQGRLDVPDENDFWHHWCIMCSLPCAFNNKFSISDMFYILSGHITSAQISGMLTWQQSRAMEAIWNGSLPQWKTACNIIGRSFNAVGSLLYFCCVVASTIVLFSNSLQRSLASLFDDSARECHASSSRPNHNFD